MNLNSPPCYFPARELSEDHDYQHNHHPRFAPDHSQSSVSFRVFFDSAQAHVGCYNHSGSLHSYHQLNNHNCTYNQGGSSATAMEDGVESGLKLTLWNNEDHGQHYDRPTPDQAINVRTNPKWLSPKKRLMLKMKNSEDHTSLTLSNSSVGKVEDQNIQASTDHSSSITSSYSNSPIRVCADCNTTKTPLWRSGPNGPKSLCNACGIRQRKARRALAAAASGQPPATKIKVQHKENMIRKLKGQVKKPRRTTASATSSSEGSLPINRQKKLRFEDFLVNLSKKLSVHRVFPDEEKNAAILLMAISSGLVHG